MSYTLGIKGKLFYQTNTITNTNFSSAGWVEVNTVTDVEVPLEKAEADATARNNAGWEQIVGVLKRAEITTELIYDSSNAAYKAIRDSFMNDTEIAIAILDLAANNSSTEGLVSNMSTVRFGRIERKDDIMRVPVTFKPSSQTFWKASA